MLSTIMLNLPAKAIVESMMLKGFFFNVKNLVNIKFKDVFYFQISKKV